MADPKSKTPQRRIVVTEDGCTFEGFENLYEAYGWALIHATQPKVMASLEDAMRKDGVLPPAPSPRAMRRPAPAAD